MLVDIPLYEQILTNHQIINGWLVDYGSFGNPQNLQDAEVATKLKHFIEERQTELATSNFESATHKMHPKDIYDTIIEMLHNARKKLNDASGSTMEVRILTFNNFLCIFKIIIV